MSKELTVSTEAQAASKALAEVMGGYNPLEDCIKQAALINAVTRWITQPEIQKMVLTLMDSPMGFITDRRQKTDKYPPTVVIACITQGMMAGARITGNEINIIAENAYLTKQFYSRKIDEFDNGIFKVVAKNMELSEFEISGNMVSTEACVKYTIRALKPMDGMKEGQSKELDFMRHIQMRIKSEKYDTPDGWEGKAERKIYKKLYTYLSGIDLDSDDLLGSLDPRLEVKPMNKPATGKSTIAEARVAEEVTEESEPASSDPDVVEAYEELSREEAVDAEKVPSPAQRLYEEDSRPPKAKTFNPAIAKQPPGPDLANPKFAEKAAEQPNMMGAVNKPKRPIF